MVAQLKEAPAPETRPRVFTPTNVAALMVLAASSLWLAWWFVDQSRYVHVTDARISATMVTIASRIPGWVVEFPVSEGQWVEKGSVLAVIDPREAALKLAELEAGLETVRARYDQLQSRLRLTEKQLTTNINAQRSRYRVSQAALSEFQVELIQFEKDWRRAESLLAQEIIPEETWEARKSDYEKSRQTFNRYQAEVASAEAELLKAQAELIQLEVLRKDLDIISRREAELEVQRQRLRNNVQDHTLTSPIAGVIDETFINPGEYVYPGQRILMVHDAGDIWIKANVKETEIRHLEIGAPVNILVDAYPDMEFQGKITHISGAATSQFALLPSPNPSGNFTKITQRLEVRVSIDQKGGLLKPGMMAVLQIPVRQ